MSLFLLSPPLHYNSHSDAIREWIDNHHVTLLSLSISYHTTSPIFDDIKYLINCFVLLYIARPSSTADTIVAKLSSARTISTIKTLQ